MYAPNLTTFLSGWMIDFQTSKDKSCLNLYCILFNAVWRRNFAGSIFAMIGSLHWSSYDTKGFIYLDINLW